MRRIFPILVVFSLWIPTVVQAQSGRESEQPYFRSTSLKALEDLKHSIAILMKENTQLEANYALIKREYDQFVREYEQYAGDIERLKQEREQFKEMTQLRQGRLDELEENIPDSEDNSLVLKTHIAMAKDKVLDMDETLRVLKLKIANLEFEVRDIELARRVEAYKDKQQETEQKRRLDELQNAYQKNIQLEKELLVEIDQLQSEGSAASLKMRRMGQDIEDLAQRISQTTLLISRQKETNELLRKKKLYELRLSESQTWQYDQKKQALTQSVTDLEKNVELIDEKLSLSRNSQTQKRKILDSIMRIDQENQNLKDRIVELEQKISGYKK